MLKLNKLLEVRLPLLSQGGSLVYGGPYYSNIPYLTSIMDRCTPLFSQRIFYAILGEVIND